MKTNPFKKRAFESFGKSVTFWIALIDLVIIISFGLFSHNHVFLSFGNLRNIALDCAAITLVTAGMNLLLGAGELDISVGANIILASVIGGKVMFKVAGGSLDNYGVFKHLALGITLGVLAAILSGVLVGLINGLVVTRLRVNSFITTLGMLGIADGVALTITGGGNVQGIPPQLQSGYGVNSVFGIPIPFALTMGFVVFTWWVVSKTQFGIHLLAIGSSKVAAERAGLKSNRIILIAFIYLGFLSGVAAVLDLARFTSTDVGGHQTDALSAIAAAVIGGTALFGGKVSVLGSLFGSLLAVILLTGLVILGFPPYFQSITIGIVLIAAVSIRSRSWTLGAKN